MSLCSLGLMESIVLFGFFFKINSPCETDGTNNVKFLPQLSVFLSSFFFSLRSNSACPIFVFSDFLPALHQKLISLNYQFFETFWCYHSHNFCEIHTMFSNLFGFLQAGPITPPSSKFLLGHLLMIYSCNHKLGSLIEVLEI